MPDLKLHLDADISDRKLHQALLRYGHDVTRTPTQGLPLDASDEMQLLAAAAQGRCLATANIADFLALAQLHRQHAGILLVRKHAQPLRAVIHSLHRFLSEMTAAEVTGQVWWASRWQEPAG